MLLKHFCQKTADLYCDIFFIAFNCLEFLLLDKFFLFGVKIIKFQYFTTGVGDEMAISKALANNTSVVKFSLNWKNGGARNSADRLIMRNCDLARKKRQGIS